MSSETEALREEVTWLREQLRARTIEGTIFGKRYPDRLREFVERMVRKLELRSDRGDWRKYTSQELLDALRDEVAELEEAHNRHSVCTVAECVDVANYAMMLADVMGTHG